MFREDDLEPEPAEHTQASVVSLFEGGTSVLLAGGARNPPIMASRSCHLLADHTFDHAAPVLVQVFDH